MGKNHKANPKAKDVGRILIKEKKLSSRQPRGRAGGQDSWKHTSELQDGYDWNRINLQSVTEKDTLDEFLDTAEMAGIEFTAEKRNIKIISAEPSGGVLAEAEKKKIKTAQEEHKKFVRIPRRPEWDETTSPEQLELSERESFLNWRRSLALLQEKEHLLLTPYEKNLDVWRQLWRVIERCDVVCQIVDARNPLLYKCDDLEAYVKETNPDKEFIVLVNKADYLTENQRKCWAEYFNQEKIKVIFWSALDATLLDVIDETPALDQCNIEDHDDDDDDDDEDDIEYDKNDDEDDIGDKVVDACEKEEGCTSNGSDHVSSSEMLSQNELLDYFKSFEKIDPEMSHVTIGLVGYPNVGKSSTINALLEGKKTAVSSTPGKTKHFQTHFMDEDLCLCDCPGLVFPSFVNTKADLVLNGILPVDQMRDHTSPLNILAQLIPTAILESTYGINIHPSNQNSTAPTGEDFVSSYAKMRGYMTSSGQPDCPRASRYIIKDYLKGKLLFCHPPPGPLGSSFEASQVSEKVLFRLKAKEEKEAKKQPAVKVLENMDFDEEFFTEEQKHNPHYKTPVVGPSELGNDEHANRMLLKPWKKDKKGKKEKLRRKYQDN